MAFLETLRRGITGFSEEEMQQIEAAKAEAKATTRQLKEQARKRKLEQLTERIKQEPYTAPIKRKEQVEKLKTGFKKVAIGAYQGISSFGMGNAPQQPTAAKPQPQPSFDPLAAFGPPRKPKRGKKKGDFNPWGGMNGI